MSTIAHLWDVEAFQSDLRQLLALDPDHLEDLRQGVAAVIGSTEREAPEGISSAEWTNSLLTFRNLYAIARSDGLSEVASDLRELTALEADAEGLRAPVEALIGALEQDPRIELRLSLAAARDGIMPVLRRSDVTLDLRVAEVNDQHVLIPVVVARLNFDEPVNGSPSISFQIPFTYWDELVEAVRGLEGQLRSMLERLDPALLPDEALPLQFRRS